MNKHIFILLASFIFVFLAPSAYAQVGDGEVSYTLLENGDAVVTVYEAKINTNYGASGLRGDFRVKLVNRCMARNESKIYGVKSADECNKEIVDSLDASIDLLKGNNKKHLQKVMKQNKIFNWFDMFLLPDEYVRTVGNLQILETRKYQDGILFIAKNSSLYSGASIENFHIGFIRYMPQYNEVSGYITDLAPIGTSQYTKYNSLYSTEIEFEKDVRRAFLKNKFNNKSTQGVYRNFLQIVDESTNVK